MAQEIQLFIVNQQMVKNWTNYIDVVSYAKVLPYDSLSAENPCVIKVGSIYRMWYCGHTGIDVSILYCESTDGINWSNHQLIYDGNKTIYDSNWVSCPMVIKDASVYKMWYEGSDGSYVRVMYCDSTDGVNWNNFRLAVDYNSQETYDTA